MGAAQNLMYGMGSMMGLTGPQQPQPNQAQNNFGMNSSVGQEDDPELEAALAASLAGNDLNE